MLELSRVEPEVDADRSGRATSREVSWLRASRRSSDETALCWLAAAGAAANALAGAATAATAAAVRVRLRNMCASFRLLTLHQP